MFPHTRLQSQVLLEHADLLRDSAGPDPRMKTGTRAMQLVFRSVAKVENLPAAQQSLSFSSGYF